jgi:hypothetical protein
VCRTRGREIDCTVIVVLAADIVLEISVREACSQAEASLYNGVVEKLDSADLDLPRKYLQSHTQHAIPSEQN